MCSSTNRADSGHGTCSLIAALLMNAYVPMSSFLSLPGITKVAASCGVVFVPIFFSGVIFAATFRDSRHPDVDFGSNIAGVILGGLCENLSLVIGFSHLTLVAGGDLCALMVRARATRDSRATPTVTAV